MFEGEMPPDLPTEVKITLAAVIEDQLNDAYQNLVFAMGFGTPEAG
jgi:hypothetical protein